MPEAPRKRRQDVNRARVVEFHEGTTSKQCCLQSPETGRKKNVVRLGEHRQCPFGRAIQAWPITRCKLKPWRRDFPPPRRIPYAARWTRTPGVHEARAHKFAHRRATRRL